MSEANRRAALVALGFLVAAGCGDDAEGSGDVADAGSADLGEAPPSDLGTTEGPLPLSTELCDDPSLVAELADSLGGSGAGFGELNQATVQQMLAAPTEGPFYMVNLIKYRELAVYADGRETDLSGREANALYAPTDFLAAIGARVVFNAAVDEQIDGDTPVWEDVAIVEYPCPLAFFAMSADPGFQARAIHKDAGVETTIVLFTQLEPSGAVDDPDQSESSHPPSAEDPAFDLIHVMRFHDVAQYEEGVDEPERSGQEAWELYQSSGTPGSADIGIYTTGTFVVQGTLIGDGRDWDEVVLVRMPSRAGFQALLDDESRVAGRYHRLAALEDNYSMITTPVLSDVPRDGGGSTMLPVTADGTGTVCSSDADCPGGGVDSCLSDGSGPGFCTREGCGAGECQSPYLCCRECAAVVAGMLPFEGSACLPETTAPSLTQAPASCTCD
ncbi:MAG: hypothetical protein AAF447_19330 [Myxococcota bacterium]